MYVCMYVCAYIYIYTYLIYKHHRVLGAYLETSSPRSAVGLPLGRPGSIFGRLLPDQKNKKNGRIPPPYTIIQIQLFRAHGSGFG